MSTIRILVHPADYERAKAFLESNGVTVNALESRRKEREEYEQMIESLKDIRSVEQPVEYDALALKQPTDVTGYYARKGRN